MATQFASKFRPAGTGTLPPMGLADVMSRLGGRFTDYQWLADPGNQDVDAFLGGAMLSFDPSGQIRSGIDPHMVNAIRGLGLNHGQIGRIVQQRQALASGNTQAFMTPDGQVEMVSRGQPGWGAQTGQQVFAPGSGSFNPVENFLGGNTQSPAQGPPGSNGYNTADMVQDPVSGQMIPRHSYVQRYGNTKSSPSQGYRPPGRETGARPGTGGGTPIQAQGVKSPFGKMAFGGGFGGKSNSYQGFSNPNGRSRYERKS